MAMAYLHVLVSAATLVCIASAASYQQKQLTEVNTELDLHQIGSTQCRRLVAHFPDLVTVPHDARYEEEQSQYWSARQAELRPSCRLTPKTSQDTSNLMRYLHHHELNFAITNGGHSTNIGASNVEGGITLDLSSLSSISTTSDHSTVEIGTGARWRDVYKLLDSHGVTAAGARAGSVGVGGFLLGGGISILAPSHGWSCDTLTSVELVTANGTIIQASEVHHPDLFEALKGGGSNFGIPTSFTLQLHPVELLQSAFLRFRQDHMDDLLHEFTILCQNSAQETNIAIDLSIAVDPVSVEAFALLMVTSLNSNIAESRILRPIFNIPHSSTGTSNTTQRKIAQEVDSSNPKGYRQYRCTLTVKNDPATVLAVVHSFVSEFLLNGPLLDHMYRPALLLQPIGQAQFGRADGSKIGRNSLGLDKEQEPLMLISFEVRWSFHYQDERIIWRLDKLLQNCKQVAEQLNTLHPFVYLNYAAANQDVFEALRCGGRLEHLKATRARYDPYRYLEGHLSNPFKLEG